MVSIRVLSTETEKAYDALVSGAAMGMLYHSIKYRNFLREILEGARDSYLLAFEDEELTAAIPVFIKEGALGTVVNSLPFYGSHGSIVYSSVASQEAKTGLLDAFDRLCLEQKAVTSTIISNPLDTDLSLSEIYSAELNDKRIGQITPLPCGSAEDVPEILMDSFHQKTRNMVRKGQKSDFECSWTAGEEAMRNLHELHVKNMKSIGGIAKSWIVFESIMKNFEYDVDFRVYTASKAGKVVSALLLFYYNKIVEYFIPATLESCKPEQPLSYLIMQAMQDAITEKGCSLWNWGGTWLALKGVYRFKSRWGAIDKPYMYYVREYNTHGSFRDCSSGQLLNAYANFYTIPFSGIDSGESVT